jgi:molecular chaperone GrpE (heat shock protein)
MGASHFYWIEGYMQKPGTAHKLLRKMNLRNREEPDLDGVTSLADQLAAALERAESSVYDLIQHNVELTKTFTAELKNLAADFERRSEVERTAMEQRFVGLQKAIDKTLTGVQRQVDANATKLMEMSDKQGGLFRQEQHIVGEKLERSCGALANMDGSIAGIREYLAEETPMKRRYREGYDFQILKNFARQVIQVIEHLERQMEKVEEEGARESLQIACEDLIDLLDKNGIERVVPVIGSAYRDAQSKYICVAGLVDCPAPSMARSIAKVVRPGYVYTYMAENERARCIHPAKVILFQSGKEGGVQLSSDFLADFNEGEESSDDPATS